MVVVVDVDELFVRCRADLVRFATALVGPDDAVDVVSEVVMSTLSSGRLDQVDDVRAYWFRTGTAGTPPRSLRRSMSVKAPPASKSPGPGSGFGR